MSPNRIIGEILWPKGRIIEGLSEDEYAAGPGLRSTELKAAAKGPAHWLAYKAMPHRDTPAMAFGRMVHMAVLEPKRLKSLLVTAPDVGPLQSPANRAKLAKWRESLPPGSVVATEDEIGLCRRIVQNVAAHSRARNMLAHGMREACLFWRDQEFDLDCKAKMDFVTDDGLVVDIKTTDDASALVFGKQSVNLGYALSAAHYLEGIRATNTGIADRFILVVCEKSPPFGVVTYYLSPDAIERGNAWRRQAMANVREAIRNPDAPAYPDTLMMLEEPGWAPRCLDVEVVEGKKG